MFVSVLSLLLFKFVTPTVFLIHPVYIDCSHAILRNGYMHLVYNNNDDDDDEEENCLINKMLDNQSTV